MLKADEILDDLQNGYFIIQKKNGFKFGVDAVLLSDFAKDAHSKRTLDLCTGTGIVPVLLAAKTDTTRSKFRRIWLTRRGAALSITNFKTV